MTLLMDPRISIVLIPLVISTFCTLLILEVFDRQTR